jgi:hypothetical protein
MKLTICLITKGREEYFSSMARGLEECLDDPKVSLLIIDNGSKPLMKEKIENWATGLARTELVRLENNVTSPSLLWQEIFKRDLDWALFPSDDDIIEPQIIGEWRDVVNSDSEINAFASSLSLIDRKGLKTGEVITPSCASDYGAARVAAAFHEPPFLWPGLFLRVNQLPRNLPSSRYVFDWWVGVQLLISGKVVCTDAIGAYYRVHEDQESNLATSRRKYFEALIYLDELVTSPSFVNWLARMTFTEKISFWESIIKSPPIYGDKNFSSTLLTSFYKKISDSCDLVSEKAEFANRFALYNGVLLRSGQVGSLVFDNKSSKQVLPGNFNVVVLQDSCKEIQDLADLVNSKSALYFRRVGCSHLRKDSTFLSLDCDSLKLLELENAADELTRILSDEYERKALGTQTFSSGEILVLQILRRFRHISPDFVRRRLRAFRLKQH